MMMMTTRRASFVTSLSSARYAIARSFVRSFATSFVRSFVDAREALASMLRARRCDWMGGWVDRGAADDDE